MADNTAVRNAKIIQGLTPVKQLKQLVLENRESVTKHSDQASYKIEQGTFGFLPQRPTFCDMTILMAGRKSQNDPIIITLGFRWSVNLQITLLRITFSPKNAKETFNVEENLL